MRDTVLQRLTKLETQLLGESNASRAENSDLRQQHGQQPSLEAVRERILSGLRVGKQSRLVQAHQSSDSAFVQTQ
ncbi:hypothetical protein C7Y66_14650 [Chroococcidiopsis sp. CCALA 051]|nr:hypothetical protein C7Y66_14650 [Chroococcidiopsis sp. CCALA 051]